MKTFLEYIGEQKVPQEELNAKNVYVDLHKDWSLQGIDTYMKGRGFGEPVGVAAYGSKQSMDRVLFEPDSYDVKWMKEKGIEPKQNEIIFRVATAKQMATKTMSLVKINPVKGLAYFYDEESERFEGRGYKVQYARFYWAFLKKYIDFV